MLPQERDPGEEASRRRPLTEGDGIASTRKTSGMDHAMSRTNERFVGLDRSVDEFRRWALSDWRSPTTRGMLAEYFVRCATATDGRPAGDWNYVDIECSDGMTIEVKCSARLQPGKGGELVRRNPSFSIRQMTGAWSNREWAWLPKPDKPRRWADVYVLCLENETDPLKYDPLDLSQWEFFVIPTFRLDEKFGNQKSVSVSRLQQEDFRTVKFDILKSEIDRNRQHPEEPS